MARKTDGSLIGACKIYRYFGAEHQRKCHESVDAVSSSWVSKLGPKEFALYNQDVCTLSFTLHCPGGTVYGMNNSYSLATEKLESDNRMYVYRTY